MNDYTKWLRRLLLRNEAQLKASGLTWRDAPQDPKLLTLVRLNKAYRAAIGCSAIEWQYIEHISNAIDYLEAMLAEGKISKTIYEKTVKLLKGKEARSD